MHQSFKGRPMAEINVVPYIDVMLVLLIIFMITAPLLTQGVTVDLPQASSESLPQEDQQPVVVTVDIDGKYFVNISDNPKQSMVPEQIMVRVAAELQLNPKRSVLVRGDSHVDYGKVVTAMVLLQQAGAKSVGLITENPPEKG